LSRNDRVALEIAAKIASVLEFNLRWLKMHDGVMGPVGISISYL
jgi:hypothetical protein